MNIIASLACGLIFSAGLVISGMTQPAKVLGFLDVLGRWDPTLALVMAAALVVAAAGFALARRAGRPAFAAAHQWPDRQDIDRPLLVGSLLFGVGWGLVGLCPGPAIVNLASLSPRVVVFVLAMMAGIGLYDLRRHRAEAVGSGAAESPVAAVDG
jgi:uncharacterized membrane protein YedE/YeeE